MFEATRSNQHPGLFQCLDDNFISVALLALVIYDALTGEAGRLCREGAVFINSVRDRRVDSCGIQKRFVLNPDVEVFAAMSGSCVYEARTGIVRYMIAIEKGNKKIIAPATQRVRTSHLSKYAR